MNQRFRGRKLIGTEDNVLGYGIDKPYVPPLADCDSMACWYWKKDLLILNTINLEVLYASFWAGDWTGDFWRGQWYHSSIAVGNQLYPNGIHLFYDMFSLSGLGAFWTDWIWNLIWSVLSPITLFVPIDTLFMLGNNSLDEAARERVYYEVGLIVPLKLIAKDILCGKVVKCMIDHGWEYTSIRTLGGAFVTVS